MNGKIETIKFHGETTPLKVEAFGRLFMDAIKREAGGLLIDFDSPGGDPAGIHGVSEAIYKARSLMPTAVYVSGECCSGAYWLAASCTRIFARPAARVGSVGCAVTYRQVAVSSPRKRRGDLDDNDRRRLKAHAHAESFHRQFVNDVARGRGVSVQTVERRFGAGASMLAAEAAEVGMIDRVVSNRQLVSDWLCAYEPSGGGVCKT